MALLQLVLEFRVRVRVSSSVFAAVGAGASDAKLTFVRPDGGSHNDWGFSVEWGGASHESGERFEVPFVDLAGFVHHHVGRRAADQRVLMKMDIEGQAVWKSRFYGAFVLHAIDATPARRRGGAGSSPCTRRTG